MIVAAARLQNCTTLLTEDLQDGSVIAGVSVRNPFTRGVKEPGTGYETSRPSRPLHPARGRPRRMVR
jgi:hypothetical protein